MKHVPRVKGERLPNSGEWQCGRLVALRPESMDSAEQIARFLVPSKSRPNYVYLVEVDMASSEISCGCEAHEYRQSRKSPYHRDAAGHYVENLARSIGLNVLPLFLREPRSLCPHARACRSWLMRHGFNQAAMKAMEASLIGKIERAQARN